MLVALATKIQEGEPAPVSAHDVAGYAAQQLGDIAITRAPEDADRTWNNFRLTGFRCVISVEPSQGGPAPWRKQPERNPPRAHPRRDARVWRPPDRRQRRRRRRWRCPS